MPTGTHNAGKIGRAALAAAAVILCGPVFLANGQHSSGSETRSQTARPQSSWQRSQAQPGARSQGRSRSNDQRGAERGYPATRPGYPAAHPGYSGPYYSGPGYARPAYPGYAPHFQGPPGHLGEWLNQHRNLPVQQQERMLRDDPNFYHLPAGEQQRVMRQLHQVNQLPDEQRQRRLARAAMLEHLPPQEQTRINLSARRWATLPLDRQTMMKHAFQDLRTVPLEQRPIVLNSERYQGAFTPEERGILSDMLLVEPYQPVRP